nr:PREDICTED: keratin-associated protein 5-10-like [Anolis carolinensis]|eukprot:XP_016852294.1 PREDICTED: keratin-associated protein 5-10-like [Anolis carolinensis]
MGMIQNRLAVRLFEGPDFLHFLKMACCGSGCCGDCCGGGYGGYGGYGGGYGGDGGGVLAAVGVNKNVHVRDHGCTMVFPTPYITNNGDFRMCCREVCAHECCKPCCCGGGYGGYGGGDGGYGGQGPGLRVDMRQAGSTVHVPGSYLFSCYPCASSCTECCDPCCCGSCCGPC